MSDAEIGDNAGSLSTDVFSALSNETRLRLLVALAESWRESWPDGLRYNELMSRIDVEDSGKFNYHLQQLRPEFVVKRDDVYKVTLPGLRIYQMLVAGYVEQTETQSIDPDADCPRCGTRLDADHTAWNTLVVSCSGCGMETIQAELLPRCVASHGVDAVLRAADLVRRQRMFLLSRGVCPYCSGEASVSVADQSSEVVSVAGGDHDVLFVFECGDCGWFDASTPGGVLYSHPVVAGLFADRGERVYDYRTWDLAWVCTDDHTTVRRREPWRIEVSVAVDGTRHPVTLDGNAAVVDGYGDEDEDDAET